MSYLHKVKWNHSHWEVSQLLTVSNRQMLNVTIEYFGEKNRGEIPLFWILTYFMYSSFTYFNPRYLKFRISVSTKNWRYPKFMKVFSLDETATAVHDKNVHNWKLKFVYTLFFFFSTSYFYRHYVSSEPCGARDILNTLFLQCCEINFIN